MLSNTSKYAIRAVIFVALFATPEKKAGLKEISKELGIPSPFLGKILQMLTRHQILDSAKGPNGGFSLKKPAIDIPLIEIIEIIDGPNIFKQCLIRTTNCSHDAPCCLHEKYAPYSNGMRNLLLTESVANLASEYRKGNEKIML
ncbi:MAG: Rrf2 family transcriptional regulator [Bacteroidetes bacterium]|nr:Rrf2 family transcriptional regulator [Bacteroidota bacterium]